MHCTFKTRPARLFDDWHIGNYRTNIGSWSQYHVNYWFPNKANVNSDLFVFVSRFKLKGGRLYCGGELTNQHSEISMPKGVTTCGISNPHSPVQQTLNHVYVPIFIQHSSPTPTEYLSPISSNHEFTFLWNRVFPLRIPLHFQVVDNVAIFRAQGCDITSSLMLRSFHVKQSNHKSVCRIHYQLADR